MIRSRVIYPVAACTARYRPRRMANGDINDETRRSKLPSNIRPRTSETRHQNDARANCLHGSQATAARGETIAESDSSHCSPPPSVHVMAKATMISNTCAKARAHPSASPRRGLVANCDISPKPQGLPASPGSPYFITATPPLTLLAPTRIHGRLRSDLASH